jgi:hypothetical protein
MQSAEFPVSVSAAPFCVKLAFDKAWFHIGPAVGLRALCGAWHGRQTWPVPSRVERSCGVPAIPAQATVDISATAQTAIATVVLLIPFPLSNENA